MRILRRRAHAHAEDHASRTDKIAAVLALVALLSICATTTLPQLDAERQAPDAAAPADRLGPLTDRELFVGGYTGAPYTYPGDVRFQKPDGSELTVHDVGWDARPFDDPIYYGVRVARWSGMSPFGSMVDFTHSKVYSQREQEVRLSGQGPDAALPATRKIRDIFHHFEFTHGHNMLTLNGLFRLPWRTKAFSPYVGLGAGVSIPHTEVQFRGERGRTYEYQLTGPVLQVVAGLEIRVPRLSYFVEYKFTFAPYRAPLHLRDGTTVFADLWRQFLRWWEGREPAGGWLTTRLTSHQVIAGMGYRSGNALAAP
ncbi:MAG: hypothetical protein KJZ80_18780 [Hyphomicrobiaceae bacterium]|nr:hypothetical protein [Hyphomicrobiaceae bacterium]